MTRKLKHISYTLVRVYLKDIPVRPGFPTPDIHDARDLFQKIGLCAPDVDLIERHGDQNGIYWDFRISNPDIKSVLEKEIHFD